MIDGSLRRGGGEGAPVATPSELEAEQAHVDRAYQRVDELRSDTQEMLRSVLDQGRGGTHQFREGARRHRPHRAWPGSTSSTSASRRCASVASTAVSGTDPVESFHIGRLGVSGEGLEPLVVDWRAPVAEPFYRATGRDPMGLVLRRHLAAQGRRIVGLEDERFSPEDVDGAVNRRDHDRETTA